MPPKTLSVTGIQSLLLNLWQTLLIVMTFHFLLIVIGLKIPLSAPLQAAKTTILELVCSTKAYL